MNIESFWLLYTELVSETFTVLLLAYLALLLSWPGFLLLEKFAAVHAPVPRTNYVLNWKITGSNLLLAPAFAGLTVWATLSLVHLTGFPSLSLTMSTFATGSVAADWLLQGTLVFFIACFVGDFSYYWWHRAQHQIPFLWEIHKLHHSDENLNTTTIFRSHFLEPAGQALVRGLTIGLIFDLREPPATILAIVAGGLLPALWDYFIHANVRLDSLNRVLPWFSVPQFHWIHHSRMPQHQDKNFAIWLPLFDVAFGTYYKPAIGEYPATGLSSGETIETVWHAQTGPFAGWYHMLMRQPAAGTAAGQRAVRAAPDPPRPERPPP